MPNTDVFYFNPTCELAVANGSFSYMPPRLLRGFEHDCSVLPFVFGKSGDFVLTEKIPSGEFIMKLADVGFEMPEFCLLKELIYGKTESFGSIFPWGWSPAAHFILKDLKAKCSPEFRESPVFSWTEEYKTLFERITSLHFLNDFLKQNPLDFFIGPELTGTKVTGIEEIENLLKRQVQMVLKAPMSSSGRGIQIIRKPILNTSNRQWISGILNQQKYLIAEPFLNKVVDFSFQFKLTGNSEPEYLGYSVFETNTNGQYRCSLIHPEIENSGFSEISPEMETMIGITAARLKESLKHSVYASLHRGFLGIDAMIYRDWEGLKIQPCIEINSRMNMGILTMQIEKKIHQDTTGKYELFYGPPGEFRRFATEKALEQPLKLKNGKLKSGFLSLVEPEGEKQFGAYVVAETAK
jgi:hypothetical protein